MAEIVFILVFFALLFGLTTYLGLATMRRLSLFLQPILTSILSIEGVLLMRRKRELTEELIALENAATDKEN